MVGKHGPYSVLYLPIDIPITFSINIAAMTYTHNIRSSVFQIDFWVVLFLNYLISKQELENGLVNSEDSRNEKGQEKPIEWGVLEITKKD